MTYLVGMKYGTYSAIICDTRVTFDDKNRESSNFSLKSGSLFPGCMYALCGSFPDARQFLMRSKDYLTGTPIHGLWDRFADFAQSYNFPNQDHQQFELLLSSRHAGAPTLYVLDSRSRCICAHGDLVTLGSGKPLLDDFVKANFAQYPNWTNPGATNLPEFPPFFLCLLLMELVQGYEVSLFEKHGVGGYFHFSYQTTQIESRQPPTVYVLCNLSAEKQTIYTWVYRIAFAEAALVVECPQKNMRFIQLDTGAWMQAGNLSPSELEDYRHHIDQLTEQQPYYNLCGFGSANPQYTGHNPIVITNQNEYVIARNGKQTEGFEMLTRSVFQSFEVAQNTAFKLQQIAAPSR